MCNMKLLFFLPPPSTFLLNVMHHVVQQLIQKRMTSARFAQTQMVHVHCVESAERCSCRLGAHNANGKFKRRQNGRTSFGHANNSRTRSVLHESHEFIVQIQEALSVFDQFFHFNRWRKDSFHVIGHRTAPMRCAQEQNATTVFGQLSDTHVAVVGRLNDNTFGHKATHRMANPNDWTATVTDASGHHIFEQIFRAILNRTLRFARTISNGVRRPFGQSRFVVDAEHTSIRMVFGQPVHWPTERVPFVGLFVDPFITVCKFCLVKNSKLRLPIIIYPATLIRAAVPVVTAVLSSI